MFPLTIALACAGSPRAPGPTHPHLDPTHTPTPTTPTGGTTMPTSPVDLSPLALPAGGSVANGRFSTADQCATCHSNSDGADAMRDELGAPVAPYDLWRSVMMANSARDPIWRAQVSAEVAATPAAAAAIEAKCLRCHAPMASVDAALTGAGPLRVSVLTEGSERSDLALDGVSCTVCHQIEDVELGADASFSGGYTIVAEARIYGPHASPFTMPMIHHSGFTPTVGSHVRDSGLCATCHVLEGHALGDDGAPTGGAVLEQSPYLEWAASDYAASASCQSCHLPTTSAAGAPISTAIARNPGGADFPMVGDRAPYGRHLLVGGNTLAPRLFQAYRDVISPAAPDAAFEATLAAARESLARAATVEIRGATFDGGSLAADIDVRSLTGHKLPTGVPPRRVWLRVRVTDATGARVFEAGGVDEDGRIVGAHGALAFESAGGPVAPHVDAVTSGDTVAVWEGVLADESGAPTFRFTRAAGWVKDDRLLPAGFSAAGAEGARVVAVGVEGDPDFGPGGDTVHLALTNVGGAAPHTVEATLLYQPLSARWIAELLASGTPEAAALGAMLDAVGNGPEVIATAAVTLAR